MREYLHIDQLAELTPWTSDAIKAMVRRGVLVRGQHYFQPLGHGSKMIFKWSAVVGLIESVQVGGPTVVENARAVIPLAKRCVIDVDEAASRAKRLLG